MPGKALEELLERAKPASMPRHTGESTDEEDYGYANGDELKKGAWTEEVSKAGAGGGGEGGTGTQRRPLRRHLALMPHPGYR